MNYKTQLRIAKLLTALLLGGLIFAAAFGLWKLVDRDVKTAEGATILAPGESLYVAFAVNDTLGNHANASAIFWTIYRQGKLVRQGSAAANPDTGLYVIAQACSTAYGLYAMNIVASNVTGRSPHTTYSWQVDSLATFGRRPALAAIYSAPVIADSVWGGNNSQRTLTKNLSPLAAFKWNVRLSNDSWCPVFLGGNSGVGITGVTYDLVTLGTKSADANPPDISAGWEGTQTFLNSTRWREIGNGFYVFELPDSLVGASNFSEGVYFCTLTSGISAPFVGSWTCTDQQLTSKVDQTVSTVADSTWTRFGRPTILGERSGTADSVWTRFGRITPAGQAAIVSDSVWANHGRTLDNPTGAYSVILNVLSSSDSSAVPGVHVSVGNLAESSTYQWGTTLANGQFRFTSGNDSLVVTFSRPGNYTFSVQKDTLVVSGANLTATYYATPFDPGSPGSPDLVRIYGYLIDADGDSISGATVKAQIVGAQNLYDTTTKKLVTRRQVSATSAASGYWYLDLVPNANMTPSGSKYEFIFSTGDRKTVTVGTSNAAFADLN